MTVPGSSATAPEGEAGVSVAARPGALEALLTDLGWREVSPGILVSPKIRPLHGPTGTCVPECPSYLRCHCIPDCPITPTISPNSSPARHRVRGRPFVHAAGHAPTHIGPPLGHAPYLVPGSVPFEKVKPLLDWLEDRYGSHAEVAWRLGMTFRRYSNLRRGKNPMLRPHTVERVRSLVLAHRRPHDPLGGREQVRVGLHRPSGTHSDPFSTSLDAAPLAELLRRQRGESLNALAGRYAARFGVGVAGASRMIQRILSGQPRVSEDTADRLCLVLGTHLETVYGGED